MVTMATRRQRTTQWRCSRNHCGRGANVQEFQAEVCTTDSFFLGESCRWDEVRGELCWVDVYTGRFFRAHADATNVEVVRSYEVEGFLSAVAPMRDRSEGWIVGVNQSIAVLDETGGLRELARPEAHNAPDVRMNDGAADPWGRFWIGSMASDYGAGRGSLYRFHESKGVEKVLGDLTIANGLGWSPDRRTMYFVDSVPGTIHAFDVDEDGEISNKRLFAELDGPSEGAPDGLCVDAEGSIWVAVWGGYEVRRYAPSGELTARVKVPTAQPSCCAIGGEHGTSLYVTTAREEMSAELLAREPDAGRLFCAEIGVRGVALDAYCHTVM
jgi:sugar lactone lactonase YvrE